MPTLFDPIRLGAIEARNRIIMAPLTRARATRAAVPVPIMAEYYAQRASAGLIISEATGISRAGLGWPHAPGIWNEEQVAAWRPVTEAVHAAGGRIVSQLWHMGRVVHPSVSGQQPVSASAITAPDLAMTYEGEQPYTEPRPLRIDEVPALLADYAQAARNAIAAGFDGVQIHAANGYLIDQFLRDSSNHRTDIYGGSIENRTRLLGEVTRAVVDAVGAERTGVRLSPNGAIQGVDDSDPEPLFTAAAALLSDIGIAFLEIREPRGLDHPPVGPAMRRAFDGPFIVNAGYDAAGAQAALDSGAADAVSFGKPFIANPDLPQRFSKGLPILRADVATFYAQGPEGYIDYPSAA
ncbi:alkene reductase [Sphingomonas histidinilytica]|jgi:2,4-dienoyl-CoA reductase-like NADH-dependent reductase (Old Yellow Enzyme family)|uniref:2,4-dienoyl-CoA reductase n=1 Tax=Rhizorhabdus histidinilytica TaxID=439228 RepID=A0A1T5FFW9_9SPHN|nr:alkene reductase [Rhizorhabdus histidinilytica]MBO9375672.1 alkene reductase [Rhizorhabdus histidinilytica]QEH81114.1 alkene reductase [Sphingomonas sp. C8-2]SKB95059.1 2,4-dienoyl-CoA reductase [Rhizorhabdus histidinilytica]